MILRFWGGEFKFFVLVYELLCFCMYFCWEGVSVFGFCYV